MKKIYSLLLLGGLLLLGVQNVMAATLGTGDKLYMIIPSSWDVDDAQFAAYFYSSTSDNNAFSGIASQEFSSKIYSVSVPTGTWDRVIMLRCSNSATAPLSWSDKWNQSGNLTIDGNFAYGSGDIGNTSWSWYTLYSYTVSFDNTSTSWETVNAYAWHGTTEFLGATNGVAVDKDQETNLYTLTFMAEEGSNIRWNDGTNETVDLHLDNFKYTAGAQVGGDGADKDKYTVSLTKTITPTSDGYATFYSKTEKVSVPSGVTAYTGTYADATETLTLHALLTNPTIVPANTPVVLKRTSGTGSFELTVTTSTAGTVDGTNNLHGTVGAIASPANAYVLGYTDTEHTAFYPYPTGKIAANKAYLVINNGVAQAAGVRIVEEGNDATDIDAIGASEKAVKFFENGQLRIVREGITYDAIGRVIR